MPKQLACWIKKKVRVSVACSAVWIFYGGVCGAVLAALLHPLASLSDGGCIVGSGLASEIIEGAISGGVLGGVMGGAMGTIGSMLGGRAGWCFAGALGGLTMFAV